MSATSKRFGLGFAATAIAAMFWNLLPYLLTRGAYHGDRFEVVGFPFTFRRIGGIAGIYEFSVAALLADIVLGLCAALLVGYVCTRIGQRSHP